MNEIEFNFLLRTLHTNAHSIEILYNYYYSRIIIHIRKKYGSVLAEDVAQDFFNGLLKEGTFPTVTHTTAWVYSRCENIAKRKIGNESKYVYTDEIIKIAEEDDALYKEELYGDLYYAINQLNSDEQDIIEMYYWEGYKLKEIAKILNIQYAAVKQKHKRIIKKIKSFYPDVTFLGS